jgi:FkbM family methyltransferase
VTQTLDEMNWPRHNRSMKRFVKQMVDGLSYELRRKLDAQPLAPEGSRFQPFVDKVRLADVEFLFWVADGTAAQWYRPADHRGFAEHTETARLLRPGDRVLEIGSHHGFTAMLLSQLVGKDGFVLAVEPSRFNAMIACAQVGLNGVTNCRVLHAAASDTEGVTRISLESNATVIGMDRTDGIEVPAVTVDELDAQFGPFDVLKVDVEGYEGQVLQGARAVLRRRPRVLLELHSPHLPSFGTSAEEVLALLGPDSRGTFVTRQARDRVHPFAARSLPADDIVNLFLDTRPSVA